MQTRRSAVTTFGARLPIRWRIALLSFGLLAILLAALGAFVSISAERTLLSNRAVALRQEVELGGRVVRARALIVAPPHIPLPPTGLISPDAIPPLTLLVGRLTGPSTRVALLSTTGQPLVASETIFTDGLVPIPDSVTVGPAITRAAAAVTPAPDAYDLVTSPNGQRQLVVLLPIVDLQNNTTVAVLQVSTPTAPIDSAVASMRLVLALGIAGALGIAAALTFPLLNTALSPLVAMERASKRIADGALSLRLEVPPAHDEIGRLARSFNAMVAQLEVAFTRQKQFVADVSHELRTPLTALGGGLEMLMLGADRGDVAAARRLTRGMYMEVERMRRLVEDLLTLTRLDEGRASLRADPVDVGLLLEDVRDQAEHLAHGQDLTCEVAPDLVPIRADADRLRQVLLNLIDNALQFTPPTGQIALAARREEPGEVALEVRDTGEGIPAEVLPHVFERFYRGDPARARLGQHGGGSGLGLSIAESLVTAQGGAIAIASAVPGGTTVTLRFPAAQPTESAPARLALPKAATHGDTAVESEAVSPGGALAE